MHVEHEKAVQYFDPETWRKTYHFGDTSLDWNDNETHNKPLVGEINLSEEKGTWHKNLDTINSDLIRNTWSAKRPSAADKTFRSVNSVSSHCPFVIFVVFNTKFSEITILNIEAEMSSELWYLFTHTLGFVS
jgi:hypothetical protein